MSLSPTETSEKIFNLSIELDYLKDSQYDTKYVNPETGETLLHSAVRHNDIEFVKKLIAKDSTIINKADNLGDTPIILAIEFKYHKITKLLIDLGANLNTPDANGAMLLHHAICKNATFEIIEMMIKKGAKTDTLLKNGTSANNIAESHNRNDVVKLLSAK